MENWVSSDLIVTGVRLHYTRTGGGKPALVLAHGFSDDGLCWTPVAQALSGEYDVVMVDARCHGRSNAPDAAFGLTEQVDDLAGVIMGLGLVKPIILGHSMGAMTTLALAGLRPDMPQAILLEDPPASWMPDSEPPASSDEWRERTQRWVAGLRAKTREQLIAEQRAASPAWSEAELGPWADSKLRLDPKVTNRDRSAKVDWGAVAQRVACPALLITADREKGAIVSPEQAEALRGLIPQLRLAHVARAGHSIRRERFEPYMEVVRSFLADVNHATM